MTEQDKCGEKLPAIHQLGFVVKDVEKTCEYLTSTLGLGPFAIVDEVDMEGAILRGEPVNTKIKVGIGKSGAVQMEFIQPIEGNSPYAEFLSTKGEGIHHIAFQVEDLENMLVDFAKRGLEPVFSHDLGIMDFAYFDISEFGGPMIELLRWKKQEV